MEDNNDLVFSQLQQELPLEHVMIEPEPQTIDDFSQSSFFSIKYYRQYFNVDTSDVLKRILISINPRDTSFFQNAVPPDLYGAIWIPLTVSFFQIFAANIIPLVRGKYKSFNFASFIACNIISFLFVVVGPIVWTHFTKKLNPPPLITTISMFGYFMINDFASIFICTIVGGKADVFFAFIIGCVVGFIFYLKLKAAFLEGSSQRASFYPNLCAAIGICLTFVLLELVA